MPEEILINGNGIAACCCASLLSQAGFTVVATPSSRGASPMLMLSGQTQRLLIDVFGGDNLFADAVHIKERVVLWGQNDKQAALPHSGLVISESALLERLWPSLTVKMTTCEQPPSWNVISSKPSLPVVSHYEFGSRIASTNSVELRAAARAESCWVESVKNGWLFLIPCGAGIGALISVGASPNTLLAESRLVSDQIETLGLSTGGFPAYPRIVTPLCGSGWIACGTAALAFDPIAGEGAGNALREGILASAVIRAAGKEGAEKELLSHYSNRMTSGFLRHLQDCRRFYEGVAGPWWESELEFLRQGIGWARKELASNPAGPFRLLGFELRRNYA